MILNVRIQRRSAYSGWVLPAAEAPDGLRQVFLVEQGGVEAQQGEVQVEQRTHAYSGNDGAQAHLAPQPPADEHDDHLHGGPAHPHRPVGPAGQHHHEGVPGTGAQGAFHIHPGAQGQQLHAAKQGNEPRPEAFELGDPAQIQKKIDKHGADKNIGQGAQAEAFAAEKGNGDDRCPHNSGSSAEGHTKGENHALLKHAPGLQADVGLKHQGDAHGADQQSAKKQADPAEIFPKHSAPPDFKDRRRTAGEARCPVRIGRMVRSARYRGS